MRAMSVLIVGGGIGGLCLASALTHAGIACEIVEREPAWATVGAGISFYPNGVRALRRLGLAEAAVSAGAVIESVRTCDRSGRVVGEFPGEYWEGIGPTFAIHRAALQRLLLDAIAAVPVHMGASVASLIDRGDAVDVELTNGAALTASLVVGADGIRSRVGSRADAPSDRVTQCRRATRTPRTRNARDVRAAGRRSVKEHHYNGG